MAEATPKPGDAAPPADPDATRDPSTAPDTRAEGSMSGPGS